MQKQKVGVIGLGYWGPHVARNLLRIPQISIIACDKDKKQRDLFAKQFPQIPMLDSFEKLLEDQSITAVVLVTPPTTHFRLAKWALSAGKHVLIEKPMTTTSNDAKKLVELAKKQNRILMVGHTFVYSESVREIKKMLTKHSLGQLLYYDSTRVNLGILQKDTNVAWDLAVHDFSILDFLIIEKPRMVHAFGSTHLQKQKELAHIILSYPSSLIAHIHVSWLSPVKIRMISLGGSKKMVTFNDVEPTEKIRVYERGIAFDPKTITPFAPAYRSGAILLPHIAQKEALFTQLSHFVECIKRNKKTSD